jgi:ankyrin repeat protein
MKHLLLTTIAAVLLVGCGKSPKEISIHKAAGAGNIEAVKQHLAAGTDVNAKDFGGGTPLHRATTKEIAELLIAKDADVNVKDKFGGTPLHNAAHRGRKEIAELLIDNGADLNVESYGETPLDTAINWKHPEIADLLRKHGGKTERELIAEAK